jgi:hypothetical protein
MDPDEPAAVSVAAPCPVDDQGEALVYSALEESDTPAEPAPIWNEPAISSDALVYRAPEESSTLTEVAPVMDEQSISPEQPASFEEAVEEAIPSAGQMIADAVITEAVITEAVENPEASAATSDSLLRYSGGGLGWGPIQEDLSTAEPPPQPSPGVPGEGEDTRVGFTVASVGQSTILNPPSSENISVDEELENDVADDRRDDELDQVCEDPELEHEPEPVLTGATWTIPMLCAGIGLIACCIIIPQADSNRRLAYEKQMLQADLESVQRQVTVNGEFLNRVVDDPALSERLAQRQLKRVRKGQRVLQLKEDQPEMSPFQITNIAPPAAPPPYKPVGGIIAGLCYDARTRLYLMGVALTMIAGGLVLGSGARQPRS